MTRTCHSSPAAYRPSSPPVLAGGLGGTVTVVHVVTVRLGLAVVLAGLAGVVAVLLAVGDTGAGV